MNEERLPNGLTPEQDAAMEKLAEEYARQLKFNPHSNTTADGKVIERNMLVTDYDREIGFVIRNATSDYIHNSGLCDEDHWFEVEYSDGRRKNFNGTRLHSGRTHK